MATHLQKAALAADPDFLKRVTHAVAKFATYILQEDPAAQNHKARHRWASSAILNPGGVAAAVAHAVTLDAAVDYGLGNVLDQDLQPAVESACNLLLVG
jgi:hypothetical protein